jgi:hypothetical protein
MQREPTSRVQAIVAIRPIPALAPSERDIMTNATKPWRVCQAGQIAQRAASEVEARQLATVLSMRAVNEQSMLAPELQQTATIWVDDPHDAMSPSEVVATYLAGRDLSAPTSRVRRTAAA